MQNQTQLKFESLVSFEGCKTVNLNPIINHRFESLVSFEGCKTKIQANAVTAAFESLVSFEGCKTAKPERASSRGLRVL